MIKQSKIILYIYLLLSSFYGYTDELIVIYDSELTQFVPKYKPYGGDSFTYRIYNTELPPIDLLEAFNVTIKPDYSNIELVEELGYYKVYKSPTWWLFIELAPKTKKPTKQIADCMTGTNFRTKTKVSTCDYRVTGKGLTISFTLDENNFLIYEEVAQTLIDDYLRQKKVKL